MSDQKSKIVSIIYSTRNSSPRHLEINKKQFILYLVLLPIITLIGIVIGFIGLIHTSPFHLIENYQQNLKAREAVSSVETLKSTLSKFSKENLELKNEILELKNNQTEILKTTEDKNKLAETSNLKCDPKLICPTTTTQTAVNSIGISTLSYFHPVQMQKDRTRPASLTLNDFKVVNYKENINFQFNIINALGGDVKLAGHIVVLLKTDQQIMIYPMNALTSTRDHQINYTAGEPFATQRFRPVDASFPKPKKGGNFNFTVFIFGKNGDLIHYQSVNLAVKI